MDRRVEKTKRAIQEAYFELLMKQPTGKITISEIARRANIDRKTFYLHYDSIDTIMKEFAQDRIDELVQRLKPYYIDEQPLEIHVLFDAMNHIVKEHFTFFQFISQNTKYDYFFDRLKELFVSILINDYQKYFDFSEVEFRIYADYFVAGILSAYMRWIREQPQIPLEKLAGLLSAVAFGGLKELLPWQLNLDDEDK